MRFIKLMAFAFVLTLCANTANAQDAFETQMKAYKLAKNNYDYNSAITSVYTMLAIKPERTDLNDTLALLYFVSERYGQSYLIGENILKANPNRPDMLEIVAVSKQNLGLVKEALADFEKLYSIDKSIYYLYQVATLQYQLKRYGECVASLDQIIANPDAAKQVVPISMPNAGQQEVPMKAAALNVKGICALELNQEQIARDNFNAALQAAPDFLLPKGNLAAMDQQKKQQGAATTAKPATTTTPAKPTTTGGK
jgi:tetratricopeptide (TPR) repeat protein